MSPESARLLLGAIAAGTAACVAGILACIGLIAAATNAAIQLEREIRRIDRATRERRVHHHGERPPC